MPPKAVHPISLITEEMVAIFTKLGFSVALGPEMETEENNFDLLNFPKDHPARDMQDTFWIKDKPGFVLRTHTSGVQVRYMKSHTPPLAMISPGKVFRNEATDITHEMQFHQLEGLVVGEGITVEHLKGLLQQFLQELFGPQAKIRLRPSFFPFVEPGFEVDVWTGSKWIELLGAGMVHPNVLKNGDIDPTKYSGFAFGIGIDRIMMVKGAITDVRYSYQGDLRFNQW